MVDFPIKHGDFPLLWQLVITRGYEDHLHQSNSGNDDPIGREVPGVFTAPVVSRVRRYPMPQRKGSVAEHIQPESTRVPKGKGEVSGLVPKVSKSISGMTRYG